MLNIVFKAGRFLSLSALLLVICSSFSWADKPAKNVYELRTYIATAGNLDNLHARFRDHTHQLFLKHGMQVVGYWTPVDKANTLVYMLAHASRESAAESWRAFVKDPQWQAVSKASNANGAILAKVDSVFLSPTDYSPLQ